MTVLIHTLKKPSYIDIIYLVCVGVKRNGIKQNKKQQVN